MEPPVPCPACKGTGLSPSGTYACICCQGKRTIPDARAKILAWIREDLSRRLAEVDPLKDQDHDA